MKFEPGTYNGGEAKAILEAVLKENIEEFSELLKPYNKSNLIDNWKLLLQTIDEFINIPFEFDNEQDSERFLSTRLDVENERGQMLLLISLRNWLEEKFERKIAERAFKMCLMIYAIRKAFLLEGSIDLKKNDFSLDTIGFALEYLQARRIFFQSFLISINCFAEGEKEISYLDSLNFFLYHIETLYGGATHSYYNLLLVECLDNHSIEVTEKGIHAENSFRTLESFYLEPQKIGLVEQTDLRSELMGRREQKEIDLHQKVFSKEEFRSSLVIYYNAFEKYLRDNSRFRAFEKLIQNIFNEFQGDYSMVVNKTTFERLIEGFNDIELVIKDCFVPYTINSISPFIKLGENYYTNYSRLMRFISNYIYSLLFKSRSFQVDSGFIFEDQVRKVLESNGVTVTDIRRINRKEFDVVAVNGKEILNFQCKNNFFDISSLHIDYKKITRANNTLIRYYEKALEKEEGREKLLTEELNKDAIRHFVVSRYPVITENDRIINFVDFEEKLNSLL